MSLIATQAERKAVAELMNSAADAKGQQWTADSMAKAVIDLISDMREERKCYVLVLELTPGVYSGYGPFPTIDRAIDSTTSNPMAYIAKRAAVVPLMGHKPAKVSMEEVAARPPAPRIDPEVLLDQQAFRRGWKGSVKDRARFLQVST